LPRKRKDEAIQPQSGVGLSHPPYKMRLDTVGNIARELGRLYRAGLSGRVGTAEAARLAFILKELRGALESERESAVINMPVGSYGDLLVLSVPRGSLVDVRTGICSTPGGDPITLKPCEPYPGTPALFLADQSQALPEPLPLHEMPDDPKVTRLDSWKRDEPDTA
jgi:hypothetical protein